MLIKAGVDISRLNPEIRKSLTPVGAWVMSLLEEMVVISTFEGDHPESSGHYCNDAYDIRRPERADTAELRRVRKLLGIHFDVVFYRRIIHLEYDPKEVEGARSPIGNSKNEGARSAV